MKICFGEHHHHGISQEEFCVVIDGILRESHSHKNEGDYKILNFHFRSKLQFRNFQMIKFQVSKFQKENSIPRDF